MYRIVLLVFLLSCSAEYENIEKPQEWVEFFSVNDLEVVLFNVHDDVAAFSATPYMSQKEVDDRITLFYPELRYELSTYIVLKNLPENLRKEGTRLKISGVGKVTRGRIDSVKENSRNDKENGTSARVFKSSFFDFDIQDIEVLSPIVFDDKYAVCGLSNLIEYGKAENLELEVKKYNSNTFYLSPLSESPQSLNLNFPELYNIVPRYFSTCGLESKHLKEGNRLVVNGQLFIENQMMLWAMAVYKMNPSAEIMSLNVFLPILITEVKEVK